MRAEAEQATVSERGETISESEFQRLCHEVYRDRFEIYAFNPNTAKREAVLWMLLGCLISLLSVSEAELQSLVEPSSSDPYGDAICNLLRARGAPPFDPQHFVEELSKLVENG